MSSPARYDEAADFYVGEVGDQVDDEGTVGLLALAGDVRDRRLLDVACGQGRVSRELARRGARVTGVDLSTELVDRARDAERSQPLGVDYLVANAAGPLPFAPCWFDAAVCNFALTDIDDLPGTLDNIARLLRPGGAFVYSILHPCFPGWGPHVSSSWLAGRGYFHEGWWRTEAQASRIRRAVGSNHRTVSTYLNLAVDRGLRLDRLLEPPPPRVWLTTDPDRDPVPTFLVARLVRTEVALA
jgi:SAM-dependent methyltransferase